MVSDSFSFQDLLKTFHTWSISRLKWLGRNVDFRAFKRLQYNNVEFISLDIIDGWGSDVVNWNLTFLKIYQVL